METDKMLNGLLLVDKPAGWTSHDVVAKVRGILRHQTNNRELITNKSGEKPSAIGHQPSATSPKMKVGHTGTLDPFATGLLILVIGSYTKRAGEFSAMDKTYEAEMVLGMVSTTGDIEGDITGYSEQVTGDGGEKPLVTSYQVSVAHRPTDDELEAVFSQFRGKLRQIPHKYSAKKINGQKAYDLARAGKEVKLEPKQVTVNRLQVTEYEYPRLKFEADVSSGTYIRSLAEDIGKNLGTGAYLSALRRTSVGKFSVKDAISIESPNIEQSVTDVVKVE